MVHAEYSIRTMCNSAQEQHHHFAIRRDYSDIYGSLIPYRTFASFLRARAYVSCIWVRAKLFQGRAGAAAVTMFAQLSGLAGGPGECRERLYRPNGVFLAPSFVGGCSLVREC